MYYMRMWLTLPATKRDITVTITDGTNPIEGASVTIEGTTETTDSDGEADFELYDGLQTATVTATGYLDATETFDISEHDTGFTIELTKVDTITITVTDSEDSPSAIEGATVVIGETSKTTDSNGECTFTNMPYDDYEATVSATGYVTKEEVEIAFRSNHKSFTVALEADEP